MTARKRRGAATARAVAQWFRDTGWPFAMHVGAGEQGRDIDNMPGLAPEVKARRDYQPTAWIRQARKNAGTALPFVVHRPDGYGPERIDEWLVTVTLNDFTMLLRQAGYGTPEEKR